MTKPRRIGPVVMAGCLLGCGLGALFDGIVLHQILQWHNLLSSVTPPTDLAAMKYNMLWDGLFHAVAWLVTAAGVARLWSLTRRSEALLSSSAFVGALLAGWGAFNLLEGLIDHQWLGLHHVHPGEHELAWDLGFLAWGAIMLAAGGWLMQRARGRARSIHLAY